MKRILLITPYTPDNQGVGVSPTSQLLKELVKTCIIDLVYFRYDSELPYNPVSENIHIIREEIINTNAKFFGLLRNPFTFPIFTARDNKNVKKLLKKQVESIKYDIVFFDFSQTFSYAKYIDHPKKILMAHDVIAQKYSRMKTYLRPWAVLSERKMLRYGTVVFTFSEKDCELMKDLYGIKAKSTTFFLAPNVIKAMPEKESDYFVFFGAWDRVENSEALSWFIDNVYDQLPRDVKFKVIGGGKMPQELKDKIDKKSNIEYLGFMDDPYDIIANAKAEIAPLHMGAGVKVKCVQALASGTPIIGTEVAFEGIGEKYRFAMFKANIADEYVKTIISFKYSIEDKKKLKEFFLKNYNDKQIVKYINN